jgi:hypothetical protein
MVGILFEFSTSVTLVSVCLYSLTLSLTLSEFCASHVQLKYMFPPEYADNMLLEQYSNIARYS